MLVQTFVYKGVCLQVLTIFVKWFGIVSNSLPAMDKTLSFRVRVVDNNIVASRIQH